MYMAELRRLTHIANLEITLMKPRDRLVCGIRDVDTQRKLLAVPDLTLKKALEIVQGSEAEKELPGEDDGSFCSLTSTV